MSDEASHYDVLGIGAAASKDEIRDAYQERLTDAQQAQARERAAKRPNQSALTGARDEEARVRAAWQVLSDPYQRGRYDATLELDGRAGTADLDDAPDDDGPGDEIEPARPARPSRGSRRAMMDAERPPVFTADGTQLELADTNRRLMAAAIDIVLLGILFQGITYGIIELADVKTRSETAGYIVIGTMFAVVFTFLLVPTMILGQSLGKKLTHVMLVDRATGGLASPLAVLKHYLWPIVALLLLPVGGQLALIAGLFLGLSFLLRRDGLSLGDKSANTVVTIARYRPTRTR